MKHIFVFDPDKCCACSACMVGCMDQNDINLADGDQCYRKTFDNEIELPTGMCTVPTSPPPACTAPTRPASPPARWGA